MYIKSYFLLPLMLLALTSCDRDHTKVINPNPIGEIVEVSGTVKVTSIDNKVRIPSIDSPIYDQETITTDNDSYAGLRFIDGTLGVLRPNTSIKIDTFETDTFTMQLFNGGIVLNAGKIAREHPNAFQITTPAGTINLTNPSATIVYAADMGVAFKGIGIVQNAKGIRELSKEGYALATQMDLTPMIIDTAPIVTTNDEQIFSSSFLQHEIKQFGENQPYTVTITTN